MSSVERAASTTYFNYTILLDYSTTRLSSSHFQYVQQAETLAVLLQCTTHCKVRESEVDVIVDLKDLHWKLALEAKLS